jgi:hypothetical protein
MVARALLIRPKWESLTELRAAIAEAGTDLSLPQVSKAIQALADDLIVAKNRGNVTRLDSLKLLDKLSKEWRKPMVRNRVGIRLPLGVEVATSLSSPQLKWAVTGESSVVKYGVFSQGGAKVIAVSNLLLALNLLGEKARQVPNFADLELIETTETGYFFANEIDNKGIRWASKLQTWLELQAGDARQQDAAWDVHKKILQEMQP